MLMITVVLIPILITNHAIDNNNNDNKKSCDSIDELNADNMIKESEQQNDIVTLLLNNSYNLN